MDDSRYYKRTIEKHLIESIYLEETRELKVFLPPGYDERITYPVVYCQDGEQFFVFGHIATVATRLILDEGAEPMIIVGIEMKKRTRTSDYYPEGSRYSSYIKFFLDEVIPFIEGHYSIRKNPRERLLAGDSLAATISLHLALDYPDQFQRVLSLSGAFFPITQERINQEHDLSWLQIYQLIGLQETEVKTEIGSLNILEFNRKTVQLFKEKKANVTYIEKEGEHRWRFWQKELIDGLRHFFVHNQ